MGSIRKSVELRYRPYFVHGEYPDGRVDVADSDGDVVRGVSREDARRLIDDRYLLIEKLCDALGELGDRGYGILARGGE